MGQRAWIGVCCRGTYAKPLEVIGWNRIAMAFLLGTSRGRTGCSLPGKVSRDAANLLNRAPIIDAVCCGGAECGTNQRRLGERPARAQRLLTACKSRVRSPVYKAHLARHPVIPHSTLR